MSSQNIEEVILETRDDLVNFLKSTPYEYTILKFQADWCGPCQYIAPKVKQMITNKANEFDGQTNKFIFIEVDVDECFDLYAFLKSKKMVKGIPTIFVYKKDVYMKSDPAHMFIPQASISGAKEEEIAKVINLIK